MVNIEKRARLNARTGDAIDRVEIAVITGQPPGLLPSQDKLVSVPCSPRAHHPPPLFAQAFHHRCTEIAFDVLSNPSGDHLHVPRRNCGFVLDGDPRVRGLTRNQREVGKLGAVFIS